jgi:hypothetical protein
VKLFDKLINGCFKDLGNKGPAVTAVIAGFLKVEEVHAISQFRIFLQEVGSVVKIF